MIVRNDIVRLAYGRDYEGAIIVRTFGSCAPSRLDSARAPHRPMRVASDAITKARCLFGSRRVDVWSSQVTTGEDDGDDGSGRRLSPKANTLQQGGVGERLYGVV
jgi:hypothetical protein